MTRVLEALRRWWHNNVVADDEESRRLDAAEERARAQITYYPSRRKR